MIRELFRFSPLPVGDVAPALSLTADEGTWIKLRDHAGVNNVVLLFLRCVAKQEVHQSLAAISAEIEPLLELDTRVFGINASRPDVLRKNRVEMDLAFPLLYDPLAFTARAFGAASRVRPVCKNVAFVIDKEGCISVSHQGIPVPDALLKAARSLQGEDTPPPAEEPHTEPIRSKAPGEAQENVSDIDSTTAVQMLQETDSLYLLVDVRTGSEYDADHSPIAIHIPVDEITHRYHELGQTDHLIFVCQAGGRSAAAGEFMTSIGSREIFSVIGGMSSWEGEREQTPNT